MYKIDWFAYFNIWFKYIESQTVNQNMCNKIDIGIYAEIRHFHFDKIITEPLTGMERNISLGHEICIFFFIAKLEFSIDKIN